MLINNLRLFALGLGVCSSLMAVERPRLPENGEDLVLTGGKAPEQFFKERRAKINCNGSLERRRTTYYVLRKQVADLIARGAAAGAVDQKESEMKEAREQLMSALEECGECGTNDIEYRRIRLMDENWSIADGSCHIPAKTWANSGGFDRAVEFLLNIGTYAKKKGGFPAIIEMIGESDASGKPKVRVDQSPFHSFIVVRGIDFLGLDGYSYPFVNQIANNIKGDLREFSIRFVSEPSPINVKVPSRFYDYSASGAARDVNEHRLKGAMGMWYVNSDGYLRYFTAGDFGPLAFLGEDFARYTLIESLYTVAEVMAGVEKP